MTFKDKLEIAVMVVGLAGVALAVAKGVALAVRRWRVRKDGDLVLSMQTVRYETGKKMYVNFEPDTKGYEKAERLVTAGKIVRCSGGGYRLPDDPDFNIGHWSRALG